MYGDTCENAFRSKTFEIYATVVPFIEASSVETGFPNFFLYIWFEMYGRKMIFLCPHTIVFADHDEILIPAKSEIICMIS